MFARQLRLKQELPGDRAVQSETEHASNAIAVALDKS